MLRLLIKIIITLGRYYFRYGKYGLKSFSEQNMIDCDHKNNGCKGGWPANVFEYLENHGIHRDSIYPYEAKDNTCRFNMSKPWYTTYNWDRVTPAFDENAVQQAVATVGPVSAVIDASRYTFQLYSSGVYDDPYCISRNIDHAIAIVGYGNLNSKDYWIVKNSWGTSWGQQGYILMSRNKNNQCGIAYYVSYPTF